MTHTLNADLSGTVSKRARPSSRARASDGTTGVETDAASVAADGSARRGPFRPGVWLNTRQRSSARLAAHAFHLIDLTALWGVTLFWAAGGQARSLAEASVVMVAPLVLAALIVQAVMSSLGLYRFKRDHRLIRHLVALAMVILTAGGVAGLSAWILPGGDVDRVGGWLLTVLAVIAGLHLVWSGLVTHWRRSGALTPNVVVVGATKNAERLIRDALERRDLNVLGVFDDRMARSPEAVAGVPVLGRADDLLKHRMIPYVDRIVVAIDPNAHARVRELTARLQVLPNEVSLLVDPQGEAERDAALEKLAQAPLAPLTAPRSPDRRAFNKRLQDVLVGGLALALVAPILGLVALAIRLDSPGPIFFRQRRHGFNHEEIVVWKFRSMRQEAADATASRQVTADDDRVT